MTEPSFHLGFYLAPEVTPNKNNEPVDGLEDKWSKQSFQRMPEQRFIWLNDLLKTCKDHKGNHFRTTECPGAKKTQRRQAQPLVTPPSFT